MISKLIKGSRVIIADIYRVYTREHDFRTVRPNCAILFLTYRCNSRCITCNMWKLPEKETKEKEIDFEQWKKIIDKLSGAGVKYVELFGGNVLLRKTLLIDVLHYLKQKGMDIYLPTNQIGLDDEVASAIIETVNTVYISTDGIGEHQDSIRGQDGAFKRSVDTASMLIKLRKNNSMPSIVCNTTVSRYNIDQLEALAEYAEANHFDEIHFEYAGEFTREHVANSIIDGLEPSPYFVKQGDTVLCDKVGARVLKEKLTKLKYKYADSSLTISTVNIDTISEENLYKGVLPCGKCYTERIEVTVDPSGNIIICPFINNYILGSLVNSSFDEVWNNTLHKKFRKIQNNGELEMCSHCILTPQRNRGILTSLKRIYLTRIIPYRLKKVKRQHS